MSDLLLPIRAGDLGQGYCFQGWQRLLVDFSNAQNAVLANGRSYYNIGPTKPAPELQAYPWLNTNDNRWYTFNGVWRSPNNINPNERRLFTGTLLELESYDGGSAGAVTPTSGPTWVRDTDFDGRVPMSPGDLPGSSPVKTLAIDEDYGTAQHTLTEAEGAVGEHTHAFGKYLSGAVGLSSTGNATVPTYTGAVVQGISVGTGPDTTVNLYTLPSGATAGGVTPTPFSIVPPVRGCWIVKPSGRLFYVVP